MYVRTREEGLRQIQSPYIRSSSPFGSYIGDLAQPQTLPKRLRDVWSKGKDKQEIFQEIFKVLRQEKGFPLDEAVKEAVKKELQSMFVKGSDELWLAETLAEFGPEPLWPKAKIEDRVKHVKSLVSDPGNYQARLPDPKPGGALTGALAGCTDSLKDSQLPRAFFFPGRDPRCALIISGVHGDEKNRVLA